MVDQEQVRPLAPAAIQPVSNGRSFSAASPKKTLRSRKCIRCCCTTTAIILIPILLTILILIFTVFRVKGPIIKMNGVTITRLELMSGTPIPKLGTNISMIVDVSVKNPNAASFKYSNTTTTIYYRGTEVGEAQGPPGTARARRTVRMNLTVDIMTDRMVSNPGLIRDIGSGSLSLTSYSRIGGRVKMMGIVKRDVSVKMNCTMVVAVSSRAIQEHKCKQKVDL